MKMKFHPMACPLCGQKENYDILYSQNFAPEQITVDVFSARRLPDKLHYQIVRCRKDGMVRSNPILHMTDLQKLYVRSKFTYSDELENLTTTYLRALQPALTILKKTAPILEIGCGNGFILEALAKTGYKNLTGVEPSTEAAEKASPKIRKKIVIDIFKKNLFPKDSFSFIFIFQTLDHIPQPEVFLAECARVLKPGGYLLSFHHNVESFTARLLGEKSPIIDVEHTQLFSLETTRQLFEHASFDVISLNSPISLLSLKHLFWLLPLPKNIKEKMLLPKTIVSEWLSRQKVAVQLGNVCVLGKKR